MLGYCILPLTVAMIVCRIVLLGGSGAIGFAVRLIVVTASFSWSTFGKNQSKSFIYFQQSQKTKGPEIVLLKLFRFLFIAVMFRIHVFCLLVHYMSLRQCMQPPPGGCVDSFNVAGFVLFLVLYTHEEKTYI